MTDLISVSVTRSGGFAGLSQTHTCKLADASAETEKKITDLVVMLTKSVPISGHDRDSFTYKFKIERESGTQEVSIAEPQLTNDQRQLLEILLD